MHIITLAFIVIVVAVIVKTKDPYQKWLLIHTIFFPVIAVWVGMEFAGKLFAIYTQPDDFEVLGILALYLLGAICLYIAGIAKFWNNPNKKEKATD